DHGGYRRRARRDGRRGDARRLGGRWDDHAGANRGVERSAAARVPRGARGPAAAHLRVKRAAIIVLDGVGIGPCPDQAAYGDLGSDTLGNLARAVAGLRLPNLERLGLGLCRPLRGLSGSIRPGAAYGVALPRSQGKDSTTGHWEICGVLLDKPFRTYPNGFPTSLLDEFARRTGRGWLGNKAASGTAGRRDVSLAPVGTTLLGRLAEAGVERVGIGKVDDLFAGRGITSEHTPTNGDAYRLIEQALDRGHGGFIFVNVIEFDQTWGHRNDVAGFHEGLEQLDAWMPRLEGRMREDDLIIITADHGNDPTTPSTDHSREAVPILVLGPRVRARPLGERATFGDMGATVAEYFGVARLPAGTSFLKEIWT